MSDLSPSYLARLDARVKKVIAKCKKIVRGEYLCLRCGEVLEITWGRHSQKYFVNHIKLSKSCKFQVFSAPTEAECRTWLAENATEETPVAKDNAAFFKTHQAPITPISPITPTSAE